MNIFSLLAQTTVTTTGELNPAVTIISLVVGIFVIAMWWIVFTKAGKPGWAAIIPIYNVIVILSIAGKPWWWILLLIIPLVNIILLIVVYLDFAKAFGKGVLFGIGLIILNPIFMAILAFGDAEYQGV